MKEKLLKVKYALQHATIVAPTTGATKLYVESIALIDSIIAELDSPWQPIETLPLCTRVLMWWTPINNNPYAECAIIGEISVADEDYLAEGWKPTKYWDGAGYRELERITHWMPLPKQP